eukprot:4992777-Alexandrium_andersonii.AAC.1
MADCGLTADCSSDGPLADCRLHFGPLVVQRCQFDQGARAPSARSWGPACKADEDSACLS